MNTRLKNLAVIAIVGAALVAAAVAINVINRKIADRPWRAHEVWTQEADGALPTLLVYVHRDVPAKAYPWHHWQNLLHEKRNPKLDRDYPEQCIPLLFGIDPSDGLVKELDPMRLAPKRRRTE